MIEKTEQLAIEKPREAARMLGEAELKWPMHVWMRGIYYVRSETGHWHELDGCRHESDGMHTCPLKLETYPTEQAHDLCTCCPDCVQACSDAE